tara:strand:- start:1810 stop:2025 length:216 start_codon:yes stop_codon:yes gene_type:complete
MLCPREPVNEPPGRVGDRVASRAEEKGFEPPEPVGSTVFKTAAFDRSATPPRGSLRASSIARLATAADSLR